MRKYFLLYMFFGKRHCFRISSKMKTLKKSLPNFNLETFQFVMCVISRLLIGFVAGFCIGLLYTDTLSYQQMSLSEWTIFILCLMANISLTCGSILQWRTLVDIWLINYSVPTILAIMVLAMNRQWTAYSMIPSKTIGSSFVDYYNLDPEYETLLSIMGTICLLTTVFICRQFVKIRMDEETMQMFVIRLPDQAVSAGKKLWPSAFQKTKKPQSFGDL